MIQLDPAFDPVLDLGPDGHLQVSLPHLPERYNLYSVQDNAVPQGQNPGETLYNYILYVHTEPSLINPVQPYTTPYKQSDGNDFMTVWIVDLTNGSCAGKKKCSVPVRPDKG